MFKIFNSAKDTTKEQLDEYKKAGIILLTSDSGITTALDPQGFNEIKHLNNGDVFLSSKTDGTNRMYRMFDVSTKDFRQTFENAGYAWSETKDTRKTITKVTIPTNQPTSP